MALIEDTDWVSTREQSLLDSLEYENLTDVAVLPVKEVEELLHLADILEMCHSQLAPFPTFTNSTEEEKIHLICDYCDLTKDELDLLYSDQTCIKSQYHPMPVFYILYILVIILGVVFNLIILLAICCRKGRSESTDRFFANLALGDLLLVLLCLPITFLTMIVLHYWPFGYVLCKIVSYMQVRPRPVEDQIL